MGRQKESTTTFNVVRDEVVDILSFNHQDYIIYQVETNHPFSPNLPEDWNGLSRVDSIRYITNKLIDYLHSKGYEFLAKHDKSFLHGDTLQTNLVELI